MKIQLNHSYEELVSMDNLLLAWQEFLRGKRHKPDVQKFSLRLIDNILSLHNDLINNQYHHGGYEQFSICDPKPRTIHKATVRDRLLHHTIYRILYPFFERTFTTDSFSCRNNKGTHKAIKRLHAFANIVSQNNTKTCWILKCDVRKFFHSINQQKLLEILEKYISDRRIISLLQEVIVSFHTANSAFGLPLGNLTSQLFANVYMNEFDQFVKHKLKLKYYIRYADDFVVLSENKHYLQEKIPQIKAFLQQELNLSLHPTKITIKTLTSGVDFLGWVNFPDHKIMRNKTRQRIFKKIKYNRSIKTLSSYFGLLSHGNTTKIKNKIINLWINRYHS